MCCFFLNVFSAPWKSVHVLYSIRSSIASEKCESSRNALGETKRIREGIIDKLVIDESIVVTEGFNQERKEACTSRVPGPAEDRGSFFSSSRILLMFS